MQNIPQYGTLEDCSDDEDEKATEFEKEYKNNRRKVVEKMQESKKNVACDVETISSADLDKLISVRNKKGEECVRREILHVHRK